MMTAVRGDGSGVRLEEIRRARPATGQVLVRVAAVAIDRRDGETSGGTLRTMGRHIAGTIAAPGAGVDGWPLGRPVAVQPEIPTRRGWFVPGAQDEGGLAEYLIVPADGLVLLPRDLSASIGALLPLASRAHSMLVHARMQPGDSVGIWGAGSLGGAALAVARAAGAAPVVIIDPREEARDAALKLGADAALDPNDASLGERLDALTASRGLDIALHTAPDVRAAAQAFAALARDGRGVLAGPVRRLHGDGAGGGPKTEHGDERWDGRTLSGPPRVHPDSLRRLAHLASLGRLHLPVPPELSGGLTAAAELLDGAVHGSAPVTAHLLTLS